jgi:hypothetical protein
MSSTENQSIQVKDWQAAHTVWSTVGIDLPKIFDERFISYVEDLLKTRHSYLAVKESLSAARDVKVDFNILADRCRNLCDDLADLDPLSSSRVAEAIQPPLNNLLSDALSALTQLEQGLRTANVPKLPHKKINEHLNFLVERLADAYERHLNKHPSVYTNRETDKREGKIIGFVESFNEHFLDGEIKNINERAIQRALQTRAKNPPPSS